VTARFLAVKGFRRFISTSLRFAILRRDHFRCRYCGHRAPDVRLEIDHVLPWSRGGDNSPANLVTACEDCNAGKNALVLEHELLIRINGEVPALIAGILECTPQRPDAPELLRALAQKSTTLDSFEGNAWGLLGDLHYDIHRPLDA
jgi:hypothetical protein